MSSARRLLLLVILSPIRRVVCSYPPYPPPHLQVITGTDVGDPTDLTHSRPFHPLLCHQVFSYCPLVLACTFILFIIFFFVHLLLTFFSLCSQSHCGRKYFGKRMRIPRGKRCAKIIRKVDTLYGEI